MEPLLPLHEHAAADRRCSAPAVTEHCERGVVESSGGQYWTRCVPFPCTGTAQCFGVPSERRDEVVASGQ